MPQTEFLLRKLFAEILYAKLEAKTRIYAIFKEKNQIPINKIKLPHEVMGKNVHCLNYANSSSTTEVTLLSDYEKNEATAKISKSDKREKKCIVEKTVVYGSQNTVKWMSKYVAKKSQLWSNQSMHF